MKSYKQTSNSSFILITSQDLQDLNARVTTPVSKLVRISALKQIWESLVGVLINREEPRIYQKRDRFGNSHFEVYDPITSNSHSFSSEQEVRVWLEQRYYR